MAANVNEKRVTVKITLSYFTQQMCRYTLISKCYQSGADARRKDLGRGSILTYVTDNPMSYATQQMCRYGNILFEYPTQTQLHHPSRTHVHRLGELIPENFITVPEEVIYGSILFFDRALLITVLCNFKD